MDPLSDNKPKKDSHTFRRWMLGIISACAFCMGPVIMVLGYKAHQFGVEILIADNALIGMGALVALVSLLIMVGASLPSSKLLLFSFYAYVVLSIFLGTFAIGSYMMLNDIQLWIDNYWDTLRSKAPGYDLEGFKSHTESEIQSLVTFAVTVNVLMIFAVLTIWTLITKKVERSLLPVTSLVISILGSALGAVSIYARKHSTYTSIPEWTIYIFTLMGIVLVGLGGFGYYASTHLKKRLIIVYSIVLGFASLTVLVAGIGSLLTAGLVMDYLQEDWPRINAELQQAGYDVQQNEFGQQLRLNFKFAGLFAVVNFCFFILNFSGSLLFVNYLKKKQSLSAIFN